MKKIGGCLMEAYDFEYDGLNLSDIGFIICKFDSTDLETITNGSQITFNTIPTRNGAKYELVSSEYTECLETTFQICKNPCEHQELDISVEELRFLMKWLNRKEFHKFKLHKIGYDDLYFEASFHISKIVYGDKLYGLELNMHTNRPYALQDSKTILINNTITNGVHTILDPSDEEGYIYPFMEIIINKAGNLSIYNALEPRTTTINNCKVGEIITLDYPTIETSLNSHNIQNDFNWNFFRIANTFQTGKNDLTISLPCTIKMTYSPIIKIGI